MDIKILLFVAALLTVANILASYRSWKRGT